MSYDTKHFEIILAAIRTELHRAEQLYPEWPTDIVVGAAIVAEEAGELIQAALDEGYHKDDTRTTNVTEEAIQTAAMAIRFLLEYTK